MVCPHGVEVLHDGINSRHLNCNFTKVPLSVKL